MLIKIKYKNITNFIKVDMIVRTRNLCFCNSH